MADDVKVEQNQAASDQPYSSQDRRETLNASIEHLYATFARYKSSAHIPGCPCCTSPEEDRLLHSEPLHDLGPDKLERFAFKAMTTLGTVDDFKHFLPRLLEHAAVRGGVGYADFEIVLGKLRYGDWSTWPSIERVAVEQYLSALWRYILGMFPYSPDADECLCGIANVVDDLSPFLEMWRRDNSATSAQHLADFVEANGNRLLKKKRLSNPFWRERETQMKQVIDWLTDPATVRWMETAFFRYSSASFAGELSLAVEQLTCLLKKLLNFSG